jgi:hypothetical protein
MLHFISENVNLELINFLDFFDQRRTLIKTELMNRLHVIPSMTSIENEDKDELTELETE